MAEFMDKELRQIQQREHDKEWRSSAGIFHQYHTGDNSQPMSGLLQTREEQNEEKQMKELFHMGNSFGSVVLGANKKNEMTLVVRKKQNQNGPTVSSGQKQLNQQRCTAWNHRVGKIQLNKGVENSKSAFAFSIRDTKVKIGSMVKDVGKFSAQKKQSAVKEMMPFMQSEWEKSELHRLEEKSREGLEKNELTSVREAFSREKERKKQETMWADTLKMKMVRDMGRALQGVRQKKADEWQAMPVVKKKKKKKKMDSDL